MLGWLESAGRAPQPVQRSTGPSIVSRIESGGDLRLSTLEKYLVALGIELTMQARRLPQGAG